MKEIILVGLCLLANGLLAAIEMAFVSVSRPQLRAYAARGAKRASLLLELRQKPERILSVLQIGITLVGAIAAAVSGVGAEEAISPWLQGRFGLDEDQSEALSIVLVVIPLTYLNVVFGELVPKAISLKKPHRIAIAAAPWLSFADKLLSPVVSVLESSTNAIIKTFFKSTAEINPSTEDILEITNLQSQTKQYVLNMIASEKKKAEDVMVEWKAVNYITRTATVHDVEMEILNSGHTRIPVYNDSVQNVVGLIHSKELLRVIESGAVNWQDHVRDILKVKIDDPILEIFLKLQKNRSHMAAVYDQLKVVGIVTLEDILEEVMGDLFDEDDDGRIKKLLSSRKRNRV